MMIILCVPIMMEFWIIQPNYYEQKIISKLILLGNFIVPPPIDFKLRFSNKILM